MTWLDELEKLEKAATPGPWDKISKMDGYTAIGAKTLIARVFSEVFRDQATETANANLIAGLRNAAPQLLEIARAAEKVSLDYFTNGLVSSMTIQELRAALDLKK